MDKLVVGMNSDIIYTMNEYVNLVIALYSLFITCPLNLLHLLRYRLSMEMCHHQLLLSQGHVRVYHPFVSQALEPTQ